MVCKSLGIQILPVKYYLDCADHITSKSGMDASAPKDLSDLICPIRGSCAQAAGW